MFDFRRAFGAWVAIGMLAGCSGSQGPIGSSLSGPRTTQSQTFSFTGSEQTFKVPTGVTQITVKASGASGGYASCGKCPAPGDGDLITAAIPVTPGETLDVFVGGNGFNENGYNGGGVVSGSYGYYNLDGGGASDVRQGGDALKDRVVVAGGGGSTGQVGPINAGGKGGSGGGRHASNGAAGKGGSEGGGGGKGAHSSGAGRGGDAGNGGGSGGGSGCAGENGKRGDGGAGCGYGLGAAGGGGGGGYYGGGGGGAGGEYCYSTDCQRGNVGGGGGGGGGSSYTEKTATQVVNHKGGAPAGNGQVVISWQ